MIKEKDPWSDPEIAKEDHRNRRSLHPEPMYEETLAQAASNPKTGEYTSDALIELTKSMPSEDRIALVMTALRMNQVANADDRTPTIRTNH